MFSMKEGTVSFTSQSYLLQSTTQFPITSASFLALISSRIL